MRIEPAPTPEEAAAIMAALEVLREREETPSRKRSRWRLAGLLGHPLPPGANPEGSLWSWERMA